MRKTFEIIIYTAVIILNLISIICNVATYNIAAPISRLLLIILIAEGFFVGLFVMILKDVE